MKRKTITTFALVCVVAMSLLGLDRYLKLKIFESAVSQVSPVGTIFSGFGSNLSGFFDNFTNLGNLQKENNELKEKLDKSLAEISRLSLAQKENESLKKDLNFKENHDFNLVGARIVYFDPGNIRETITIDVGKKDGIQDGDVAISEGFLIGKVAKVGEKTSKITLITDPKSAIPGVVINRDIAGIVKGKIGEGLLLEQIPQDEKINQGDLIATSGLGGQFPKGIIIGKVENVKQISGSIFQAIEARPMLNLSKIEKVMIIKK